MSDGLEEIIPAQASSAEKKQIFCDRPEIFSGRYDSATVRCILGSLDESHLRELRETLHAGLPASVPTAAGRPLCRRVAGNVTALAEDCWALGYSAAQGVLSQRASSVTLRAASRDPVPPLEETPVPRIDNSSLVSSMEALIESQLKMERELSVLKSSGSPSEISEDRLKSLEEETERLRHECSVRDARIAQLEHWIEYIIVRVNPQTPPTNTSTAARRRDITSETVDGGSVSPIAALESGVMASKIAQGLDLSLLGKEIAAALRSEAGDSDDDDPGSVTGPAAELSAPEVPSRNATTGYASGHGPWKKVTPRRRAQHSRGQGDVAPAARQQASTTVLGSGPPSDMVGQLSAPDSTATASFVLEGFQQDVSDSAVRNLVWPLVGNLHDFQRLRKHSGIARGLKAYKIEVDAVDSRRVMEARKWPAGLRIRPWTEKSQQYFRQDRQRLPPSHSHRSGHRYLQG